MIRRGLRPTRSAPGRGAGTLGHRLGGVLAPHLLNGHNRQVPHRMPVYLPGNGGLLMATALLFGGWVDSDGVPRRAELPPGWSVRAEDFPARP